MQVELNRKPDITQVKIAIENYLEHITSTEFDAERLEIFEHLVFEAAMETFCGTDVWAFINHIKK